MSSKPNVRQKLSVITLAVRDLERSLAFYEQGLGWRRSSVSVGDLAVFDMGGWALALYPREELAQDAAVSAEGAGFEGITLAHNVASEAEVDALLAHVATIGGRIAKPAQKAFWGGYHGYFVDPDGHLVEVAYNPFWPLDAAGNLALPD